MVHRYLYFLLFILFAAGCAQHTPESNKASLNLLTGWFNGRLVHYVTTDVSDRGMAKLMQANYAPRLYDAIPTYPKSPQDKTILERVYAFPEGEQKKNIFASIPDPLGYESESLNYSPIWLMFQVVWVSKQHWFELKSEEEVFMAESKGWVKITRTDVVVNCPVIGVAGGKSLQAR